MNKIVSISITEFLDAPYISCPLALQGRFLHPIILSSEQGAEREVGLLASHCSCALATVVEEGGWGTERRGGRGGVQRPGAQPGCWPGAL